MSFAYILSFFFQFLFHMSWNMASHTSAIYSSKHNFTLLDITISCNKEKRVRRKEKGERRKEKAESRKEKEERRKEKGERRKEKGERRKEKGERRKEKGEEKKPIVLR